jgi:hypothetical protein
MILYLNDEKYKIEIKDNLDHDNKPFDGKTFKLYKKTFIFFYRCISCVEVKFDDSYKMNFPMPTGRSTREGQFWSTSKFKNNKRFINNDMDFYLKNLVESSFELEDIDLENVSYKNLVREERLKKLLNTK